MPLPDTTKEILSDATVTTLLALRGMYLAAGANPIRHWDQLKDRMAVATNTTRGPEEWVSTLARELQLPAFDRRTTDAAMHLAATVRGATVETADPTANGDSAKVAAHRKRLLRGWYTLLTDEAHYLIAATRRAAEEARDARDAVTLALAENPPRVEVLPPNTTPRTGITLT